MSQARDPRRASPRCSTRARLIEMHCRSPPDNGETGASALRLFFISPRFSNAALAFMSPISIGASQPTNHGRDTSRPTGNLLVCRKRPVANTREM